MSALNEYYAALERLKPTNRLFYRKGLLLITTPWHWKQGVSVVRLKRAAMLY